MTALGDLYTQNTFRAFNFSVTVDGIPLQNVLGGSYQYSMGGIVPTASVDVTGRLPSFVTQFNAGRRPVIEISLGFNGLLATVFTGRVQKVRQGVAGATISCVGSSADLDLPYEKEINVTFVGDVNDIAADILNAAGVSSYFVNLPTWAVGTVKEQTLVFSSYGEALNKLLEPVGSPYFELPSGQVRAELRDPLPATTPFRVYFSQLAGVNPTGISSTLRPLIVDGGDVEDFPEEVKNRISVIGAVIDTMVAGSTTSQTIEADGQGASPWIPNPPQFQDLVIQNELIDTLAQAVNTLVRYLVLLNRLETRISLPVDGDPELFLGATMQVEDPLYTGLTGLWFLYGYSCSFSNSGLSSSLDLRGGGPAAGGTPQIAPFASFNWRFGRKIQQVLPSGIGIGSGTDFVLLTFDAAASRDFDGSIVSYDWSDNQGGLAQSGVLVTRAYAVSLGSVDVTLVVTDNDGLTDSLTQTVSLTDPVDSQNQKTGLALIACAAGNTAMISTDGGGTWVDKTKAQLTVSGDIVSVAISLHPKVSWTPGPNGSQVGQYAGVAFAGVMFGTTQGELIYTRDNFTSFIKISLTGSRVNTILGGGLDIDAFYESFAVGVENGQVYYLISDFNDNAAPGTTGGNNIGTANGWVRQVIATLAYPVHKLLWAWSTGTIASSRSLWAFGGNASTPSSLITKVDYASGGMLSSPDSNLNIGITIQSAFTPPVSGPLLAAVQAAGGGHHIVDAIADAPKAGAIHLDIIFDDVVSPIVWHTDDAQNGPWVASSGLAAGAGKSIAGEGQDFTNLTEALAVIALTTTYFAPDSVNFAAGGASPSQINHVIWEHANLFALGTTDPDASPLSNMPPPYAGIANTYLGAANGGVVKTIDHGDTWGYLRPHPTIPTSWPSGAFGWQVDMRPVIQPAVAANGVYVIGNGAVAYKLKTDESGWDIINGTIPGGSFNLKYFGGRMLYIGGDDLVYVSADSGDSFASISPPVGGYQAIDATYTTAGELFVLYHSGSNHYIYSTTDGGANWDLRFTFPLNGGISHAWTINASRSRADRIVATGARGTGTPNAAIFTSQDGGVTWPMFQLGRQSVPTHADFSANDRVIVQFSANYGIEPIDSPYSSGTQTYSDSTRDARGFIHAGAVTSQNLYALSNVDDDPLFQTKDNGTNWVELEGPYYPAADFINSMAYSVLGDTLYLALGGGHGGEVWKLGQASAADPANPVWAQLPDLPSNDSSEENGMVVIE